MKNKLIKSRLLQETRKFLFEKDFFEVHLPSLCNMQISNTSPIKTSIEKKCLRVSPEPEIWVLPTDIKNFYYLGGIFRNETKISEIHQYEFTIADIYIREGNQDILLKLYLGILKHLSQKEIISSELYKLKIENTKYNNFSFNAQYSENNPKWVLVTNYPIEESFYDATLEDGTTEKAELFFLYPGLTPIEISSMGKVDINQNTTMKVDIEYDFNKYISCDTYGFCFGVERILYISKLIQGEDSE